ncbi:MAG: transporter ATP-binding protein [Bradyrhizobium sp.]|nr:transporter ATP-binding protein [Bradyrhizobium sp.]
MDSTLAKAVRPDQVSRTNSEPAKNALLIRDLRRMFLPRNGEAIEALAGVSLTVRQGEVVAVLGPSGCGKSSMLRILAGLDTDFTGEIVWSLGNAQTDDARHLHSATVFQSDSTFPWMNVENNLQIGLTGLTLDPAEAQSRISRYLNLVGLGKFRRAYPHELSGGMRQRVAIARALATEPQLLLMDEPLAALDAQTRLVMQQELLRIWKETKSTVIYITHDIGEALMLADRVVVMTARPGRIKAVQDIPFGRDRDVVEMRANPAFGRLESELWRLVAEEVGHSLDRSNGAS